MLAGVANAFHPEIRDLDEALEFGLHGTIRPSPEQVFVVTAEFSGIIRHALAVHFNRMNMFKPACKPSIRIILHFFLSLISSLPLTPVVYLGPHPKAAMTASYVLSGFNPTANDRGLAVGGGTAIHFSVCFSALPIYVFL